MPIPTSKLKDVAFSSGFTYERVHMKGTINTTMGSTVSVQHDLGYVPFTKVYYLFAGAGAISASSSSSSPYSVVVSPGTMTLSIQVFSNLFGTFGDPVTLFYRIYKEKAAP